jgi:hypothetical protein
MDGWVSVPLRDCFISDFPQTMSSFTCSTSFSPLAGIVLFLPYRFLIGPRRPSEYYLRMFIRFR